MTTKDRRELIRELLGKMETRLKGEKGNMTVADYIRLTQLERELEEADQPTEVRITWIEPTEEFGTEI